MTQESLKNKTVKGTIWSTIETISRYGISFVVGIILARLLTPNEYSLIGILTIFINLFNVIVDGGFTNAIIRKQNATDIDFCTVFYINLAVSAFLSLLLFLSAPFIASYFYREELIALTRVMSVSVLINGLAIVQKAKLTKAIDFKTQTQISLTASIISGIVGITLAVLGCGVWALVWQYLSQLSLNTILLWIFNKWYPKLLFSWQSFKDLWNFGWKLLASSILDSISTETTNAVVGKYYNPATLGLYTRAKQFADVFSGNLTTVVQRVSYPVLSTIQDDAVRLKEAYRRVIRVTCLPTFILMLSLAAVAKPMILVLLGKQWIICAGYLQLICIPAMLFPLHSLNLNAIQVLGRSDLTFKLKIIKTLVSIIPISLGIFLNIYWMLVAHIFTGIFAYYLNAYYSKPLLNYGIVQQVKDILPSFCVAICISLPVYFISLLDYNCYLMLLTQIIVGISIGIALLEKLKLPEYLEIKSIVWRI
jgi:O-antigen/teichoic acid export membrane protein